ncbi:glycosyltransferase [Paenibacillus aestuarii]|uniref:Glycosyltransferase n=1 Tax=Paenibacillus aestuarii TaxID=516965 RepID=A0ABW0K7J9_9BACL|nr:glycosyltransferase [Paenibacillus aestuarii]
MNVISQIQDYISNNEIENAYQLIIDYENEYNQDALFWMSKANLCIKLKMYHTAYDCLRSAMALESYDPSIYFNMAYVCECMQMFSEAALYYGMASKHTEDEQLKQEIDDIYSSNEQFTYIKNIASSNKKRTYLILSSCGWGDVLQRMHHIARSLVKFGNDVIYVSAPSVVDSNSNNISVDELVNYTLEHKRVVDGVAIYDPFRVRFQGKVLFSNFDKLVQALLDNKTDSHETIIITYLPYQIETIKKLNGDFKVIYECVDDHNDLEYAFWGHKKDLVWEQELMDKAHAVTTTAVSLYLQRTIVEGRNNIFLSRNAVNEFDFLKDEEDTIPEDLKDIPEPRVVYSGAIFQWFDVDLFYSLVKDNPDKSFVVIGFGQNDLLKEKCKNLYFLGVKKHQELKSYLRHMQVGIIPFRDNIDIVIHCDPIKQYEYLACGLPVVATYMPETVIDKKFTFLAGTVEEFNDALSRALALNVNQKEISEFILANSWNARAALLCEISGQLEDYPMEARLDEVQVSIRSALDEYKHPNVEILHAIASRKRNQEMFLNEVRRLYYQSQTKFITRHFLAALLLDNKRDEFWDVIEKSGVNELYLLVEMRHRKEQSIESYSEILERFITKEFSQIERLLNQIQNSEDKKLFLGAYLFNIGAYQEAHNELISISDKNANSSPLACYLLASLMKLRGDEERHDKFKEKYKKYEQKYITHYSKSEELFGSLPNIKLDPFISILVPTRNAAEVIKYTLKTCVEQEYNNYEIIVSDNSSLGNDETKKVVEEINSNKIKYYRTPEEYAMVENFEHAYNKSSGEYLIIIGSDDGLMLHSLNTLSEIIKQMKNPLSISWEAVAYGWPKVAINSIRNGLFIPYPTQKGNINCDYLDQSMLKSVLNFEQRYSVLPMFYYNSIIKRELAEEVKKLTGKVFIANSPDVYTGMVFAYLQKKYLYINMPMTIGGSSERSNGINVGRLLYKQQESGNDVFFEVQKIKNLNQDLHSFHAPYFAAEESAVAMCSAIAKQVFNISGNDFDINRRNFYKKCTSHLFADNDLEIKMTELYECIKSYGDPSIIKWYESEFFYNNNFKGYSNNRDNVMVAGFKKNGGLVIDASRFGVRDVFGAAHLYRSIVGY